MYSLLAEHESGAFEAVLRTFLTGAGSGNQLTLVPHFPPFPAELLPPTVESCPGLAVESQMKLGQLSRLPFSKALRTGGDSDMRKYSKPVAKKVSQGTVLMLVC